MKCFFLFAFCTFFKKSKSVSFSRVYVCVKAKLTLVIFFLLFFLCTFPFMLVSMLMLALAMLVLMMVLMLVLMLIPRC